MVHQALRIASSGACSTSSAVPTSSTRALRARPVQRQARGVAVHAADAFCRDVVGERKEVESKGKVFKLKFLANGGDCREVECPDNVYMLDAAEKNGIDLPATCRGGICGACVARVAKGSVDMSDIPDLDFTVTPEEQAKGMALLCMARATSDCEIEIQSDWGYSLGGGDWKGASGMFEARPEPMMGTAWDSKKN